MAETVGFIGLGNMGEGMARCLLAAGYGLNVYNRTAEKADPLVEAGATRADTPGDVSAPGGVVMTMLADDRALEQVVLGDSGLLDRLGDGGIHVSLSTVSPLTAQRLAEAHSEHGSVYLAAPVFGRPDAAAAGKLWVVTSGPDAAKERVRPLLEAFSQGIFDFGDDIGAANTVKLAGNFLIIAAMEAMAEAFAMAEKRGIVPNKACRAVGRNPVRLPGLSQLRPDDRRAPAHARRLRSVAWTEGCAPGSGSREGRRSADAAGEPAPRPPPRDARPGSRRDRLERAGAGRFQRSRDSAE